MYLETPISDCSSVSNVPLELSPSASPPQLPFPNLLRHWRNLSIWFRPIFQQVSLSMLVLSIERRRPELDYRIDSRTYYSRDVVLSEHRRPLLLLSTYRSGNRCRPPKKNVYSTEEMYSVYHESSYRMKKRDGERCGSTNANEQ